MLFLGGFAAFATHVSGLSTPKDPPDADAIIVLTGGQARLDAALGLLKSGKGKRLLISGVHPAAGSDDLRAATGGDRKLFSCCVDIDHAALDTIGNAEESAKWVRIHDYGKVILVTNNYHMPRSLLEMGRLLDKAELNPYPVVNSKLGDGGWMLRPTVLRVLFTEYNKYLLRAGAPPAPARGPRRHCRGRRVCVRRRRNLPSRFLFSRTWCNQRQTPSRAYPCLSFVRWRSMSPSTPA